VVIGSIELPDENGVWLLQKMRDSEAGADFSLIVTTARFKSGAVIQHKMTQLNAAAFVQQPFPISWMVNQLIQVIGSQADSSAEQPPPESQAVPGSERYLRSANVRLLTHLWRSRASGILRTEDDAGMMQNWLLMKSGGPAHHEDRERIQSFLFTGRLNFERISVEGQDDWVWMGRMLLKALIDPEHRSFVADHREAILTLSVPTATFLSLSISLPIPMIIQLSKGNLPLSILVERSTADAEAVGPELAAMQWLNLISLRSQPSPEVSTSSRTTPHSLPSPMSFPGATFLNDTVNLGTRFDDDSIQGNRNYLRARGLTKVLFARFLPDEVLARSQNRHPLVILGVSAKTRSRVVLKQTLRLHRRHRHLTAMDMQPDL